MRFSCLYVPTLKEAPKEAEMVSHQLLIRAGYIRKLSAGIYSFLPLGWRVVHKIATIVREEMNRAGAQEVLLPAVQPAELWKESGRWRFYGPELLRFKDRKGNEFCFGPTHEEVITDLVRNEVCSYKQLPLNLYQIQTKFRDEIRPRAGLMRGREFIMKDAYSFDLTADGARESYRRMFDAYNRIFERCRLDFRAVEADTGNIGGSLSHEFQVLAQTGEDTIVSCDHCNYTANIEKAELRSGADSAPPAPAGTPTLVETPAKKTIDEVAEFLAKPATALVKTLLYRADEAIVAALVRGDHELNEPKLKALLGVDELELATVEQIVSLSGAPVGFAGPVGLSCRIVADWAVGAMSEMIVGANKAEHHFAGVRQGRDFAVSQFADLRMAQAGDGCPRCGEGTFGVFRGIEVGHVFFLGSKYSRSMGATVLDENGKSVPMEMGCYGIGVTRIMSAAIEQSHDEHGIIWPSSLAPYQVIVLPLNTDDQEVREVGESLYQQLTDVGLEVLLDDRPERPGKKFMDADLIGIPLRITVGKRGLKEGRVEIRRRGASESELVAIADVLSHVRAWIGGQ